MKNKIINIPKHLLQPVKDYLLKREKELKQRKKSLSKEDPFIDSQRLNDNAAVDAEAAEEIGHERITVLKSEIDKTLIRIRKTLTSIRLGHYGQCLNCRKFIDTDRLAVDPTADLCVDCAKKKIAK